MGSPAPLYLRALLLRSFLQGACPPNTLTLFRRAFAAGTVRIIPACLRPLTDEEEVAPPPETRTGRCIRAATFRLRRALHRTRPRGQHAAEAPAEEKQPVTEEAGGLQNDSIPEGEPSLFVIITLDETLPHTVPNPPFGCQSTVLYLNERPPLAGCTTLCWIHLSLCLISL